MRRELKANPRLEVCPPLSKDFTRNLFLDVNSGTLNHDHFKGVNVLYANIDSLLNKREELKTLILVKDPDIIILTEILPKNCGLLSLSEFELMVLNYLLRVLFMVEEWRFIVKLCCQ